MYQEDKKNMSTIRLIGLLFWVSGFSPHHCNILWGGAHHSKDCGEFAYLLPFMITPIIEQVNNVIVTK